jgi:hypothetical protein
MESFVITESQTKHATNTKIRMHPVSMLPSINPITKKRKSKLLIKKKGECVRNNMYALSAVHAERLDAFGVREYMVSWLGYSREEDSWIRTLPPHFAQEWTTQQESLTGVSNILEVSPDLHMLASMACRQVRMVERMLEENE